MTKLERKKGMEEIREKVKKEKRKNNFSQYS